MKDTLTTKQAVSMIIMFLVGSAAILMPGKDSGRDSWMAVILAFILFIPLILIYCRILNLYPKKDIFQIQEECFGKILGKIMSILLIWNAMYLSALVDRNFLDFIQVVSLPAIPRFAIALPMAALTIWVAKSGIGTLGRVAKTILYGYITIIFIGIFVSFNKLNFDNITPLLYNGIGPVINSGLSILLFPFAEIFLFTGVLNSLTDKTKILKIYFLSAFVGTIILVLIYIRNILILGDANVLISLFPSYLAVSVIKVGEFFQRTESIVSIIFFFGGFIKAAVCQYFACKGIARVVGIHNYRDIVSPLGLLIITMVLIVFKNPIETVKFASETYKYYGIPFYIIIPVLTWVVGEIRNKIKT